MRVGADDLEAVLAAVDKGRFAATVAARDDVGRGEQEAVRRDHDRAAAAVQAPPAAGAVRDAEVRDRRSEPLDDVDDRARVRVQRIVVRLARPEGRIEVREPHPGQGSSHDRACVDLRGARSSSC